MATSLPANQSTLQALIASLQALVTTAQADTASDLDVLRELVAHAQAAINYYSAQLTPVGRTYYVQPTIFGAEAIQMIALRELGDWTRYVELVSVNSLDFIALYVGQPLTLPLS